MLANRMPLPGREMTGESVAGVGASNVGPAAKKPGCGPLVIGACAKDMR